MKIAILVNPGSDSFTAQLLHTFGQAHEAQQFSEFNEAHSWGDVLWCEWATGLAMFASLMSAKPVIVRLHRFEVFEPVLRSINWSNVAALVVTSQHILDLAGPTVSAARNICLLPVGIDTDRFQLQHHRPGTNIGVVGNINARKNPFGWFQVLAALPPSYTLHILGEYQDACLKDYCDHAAAQFPGQVLYSPPIPNADIPAWWADKDYCLSTSLHDTFVTNVREAMALGVKPVVHDYPCVANEGWLPVPCRSIADMVSLIRAGEDCYHPAGYRGRIERTCSWNSQRETLLQIIDSVTH